MGESRKFIIRISVIRNRVLLLFFLIRNNKRYMSSHTFSLKGAKFKDYKSIRENKKIIPYVKKTNTVALFTNARDEKYIKEWAAHHLLLGFDYIFITDHLSAIPLTNIFHNFSRRVIISTCTKNGNIKIDLMNKAVTTAKKYKVDWFIYLDADEFIILNHKTITNIKQFLQVYNTIYKYYITLPHAASLPKSFISLYGSAPM